MATPVRSSRWLWFFVVLAGLCFLVPVILYSFQKSQELTLEKLQNFRRLWIQGGPKNYRLTYSLTRGLGLEPDYYVVVVRDGQATFASCNGRVEDASDPARLSFYGMHKLFDYIETFLKQDCQPNQPKSYHRGQFDQKTGQLLYFARTVTSSRQRQLIDVESLEILPAEKSPR
jgi:hypothetical protein